MENGNSSTSCSDFLALPNCISAIAIYFAFLGHIFRVARIMDNTDVDRLWAGGQNQKHGSPL